MQNAQNNPKKRYNKNKPRNNAAKDGRQEAGLVPRTNPASSQPQREPPQIFKDPIDSSEKGITEKIDAILEQFSKLTQS